MVSPAAVVIIFLLSFLLGSIPWGVVISKAFYHKDIRDTGSGNIGTTNAMRAMGKVGGSAVFVLDFVKGLLSGVIALYVPALVGAGAEVAPYAHQVYITVAFLACISGHIYTPWLGFKGGKGIAVAVGCLFVTFGPLGACIELGFFIVLVALTKTISAGSLAAAIACPFLALYFFWGNPAAVLLCVISAVLVIWAHRENIQRLRAGNENKIGQKKKEG